MLGGSESALAELAAGITLSKPRLAYDCLTAFGVMNTSLNYRYVVKALKQEVTLTNEAATLI